MKVCQERFTPALGRQIEEIVTAALGVCPCMKGEPCLLLDADGRLPLMPRLRVVDTPVTMRQ